jgi:hypothetical protein
VLSTELSKVRCLISVVAWYVFVICYEFLLDGYGFVVVMRFLMGMSLRILMRFLMGMSLRILMRFLMGMSLRGVMSFLCV